jgi:hypothetical protein
LKVHQEKSSFKRALNCFRFPIFVFSIKFNCHGDSSCRLAECALTFQPSLCFTDTRRDWTEPKASMRVRWADRERESEGGGGGGGTNTKCHWVSVGVTLGRWRSPSHSRIAPSGTMTLRQPLLAIRKRSCLAPRRGTSANANAPAKVNRPPPAHYPASLLVIIYYKTAKHSAIVTSHDGPVTKDRRAARTFVQAVPYASNECSARVGNGNGRETTSFHLLRRRLDRHPRALRGPHCAAISEFFHILYPRFSRKLEARSSWFSAPQFIELSWHGTSQSSRYPSLRSPIHP